MWNKFGQVEWYWQLICEGLSVFNLKILYYSCTWSCILCKERTSLSMGFISRRLRSFCSWFWLILLHSMPYFFFLYWSLSLFLCTVLDPISSNINDVLSISPSANVFVFRNFNVHYKDWLSYSGGTNRLVNSALIFLSRMT